ncbi:MAG: PEP-CTERM sorting domain-containing protein [Alteromonadaceae bacterium]
MTWRQQGWNNSTKRKKLDRWTGGPAIAVPEASSLALFSLGIIGLAIRRCQRTTHRSVKV